MKHAPSLFFLLCLSMLLYVSMIWKPLEIEAVVNSAKLEHYERSYQIDLSRGNWTIGDLDLYFPSNRFQILDISDGTYQYRVLDRSTLKQQIIRIYQENGLEKEAWYGNLHDIKIKYITVVTEEENIKKLMKQYAWIEYI